jgi:hypothetical protein
MSCDEMTRARALDRSVADIVLTTADEETLILGDRIKVPTIVILARYYG